MVKVFQQAVHIGGAQTEGCAAVEAHYRQAVSAVDKFHCVRAVFRYHRNSDISGVGVLLQVYLLCGSLEYPQLA